jgi:hypothetical protein
MASKLNLDTADKLDITCKRGDTFLLNLRLKDTDGNPIQLQTLGYTFLMQVRDPNTQVVVGVDQQPKGRVILSTPNAKETVPNEEGTPESNLSFGDVTVDDLGNVTITATNAVMKQINPGKYIYDIQSVASDVYKTIVRGSFVVNDDITQV